MSKNPEKNILYIIIIGLVWWIVTENWLTTMYFIGLIMGLLTNYNQKN